MDTTHLINRVDELIELGESVLTTSWKDVRYKWVKYVSFMGLRSGVLSFIEQIYSKKHSHYSQLQK